MSNNIISNNSNFKLLTNEQVEEKPFDGLFPCDLLSHVMGFAKENQVLITVLNNINVLGVASLLDLNSVIFPHNIKVNEEIILKANELGIPLYSTSFTSAQTVIALTESCNG